MVDVRVPQFCSVCGSRLVAEDTTTGFDPYTGEANKAHKLNCLNPTVTVSGSIRKSTSRTHHPSWAQIDGVWTQN